VSKKNKVARNFIGAGYSDCITPAVNPAQHSPKNPGWYTAYTPYQAEIAQGRLEALLVFQRMIMDLTALDIANASLLDEATAAASDVTLSAAVGIENVLCRGQLSSAKRSLLSKPRQTLGIEVRIDKFFALQIRPDRFRPLVQYPATDGAIYDYSGFVSSRTNGGALACRADILALTLPAHLPVNSAAEYGRKHQRFGVPLGFGGPHAAYFATA